jgi:hypothetical protein
MGGTLFRIAAGAWPYASHFKSRCLSLLPRACPGIASRTTGRSKNAFGEGRSPHARFILRLHFSRKRKLTRADSEGVVTISRSLASNEHARNGARFRRTSKKWYAFRFFHPTNRVRTRRLPPACQSSGRDGQEFGARRNSGPRNIGERRTSGISGTIRIDPVQADFKIFLRIGVDESAGVGRRQE